MIPRFAFILVIGICCGCLADDTEETTSSYTTKYDNINLNDLMKNDRMRKNYVACLLNEGPCTPDGSELKSKCLAENSQLGRHV